MKGAPSTHTARRCVSRLKLMSLVGKFYFTLSFSLKGQVPLKNARDGGKKDLNAVSLSKLCQLISFLDRHDGAGRYRERCLFSTTAAPRCRARFRSSCRAP